MISFHELLLNINTLNWLFPEDSPVARTIILIILFLFLIAIWSVLRSKTYFSKEAKALDTVKFRLEDWTSIVVEDAPKSNEEFQSDPDYSEEDEDIEEKEVPKAVQDIEATRETEQMEEMEFTKEENSDISKPEDYENITEPENDETSELVEQEETLYQPTVDVGELMKGLNDKLIISERLKIILGLKQKRININVEVLQHLSLLTHERKWFINFPRFVVNITLLLGMLGTFIGLVSMVQSFTTMIDTDGVTNTSTIDAITSSIKTFQDSLDGVNTAFTTTLVGLFCSVCCLFFTHYIDRNKTKFFATLEHFTINKLLPAVIPDLKGEVLLQKISNQFEDSSRRLDATWRENQSFISDLNMIYDNFKDIISDLRKLTHKESSGHLEKVISEMRTVNKSISSIMENYSANTELVKKLQTITTKQIRDHNKLTNVPNAFNTIILLLAGIVVILISFFVKDFLY